MRSTKANISIGLNYSRHINPTPNLLLSSPAGEKVVFEAVASSGAGVTATWLKDNAQLDDKLADRLKVEKDLAHTGENLRKTFIWTETVLVTLDLLASFCGVYVSLSSDPMSVSF